MSLYTRCTRSSSIAASLVEHTPFRYSFPLEAAEEARVQRMLQQLPLRLIEHLASCCLSNARYAVLAYWLPRRNDAADL